MSSSSNKWYLGAFVCLLAGGCLHPVAERTDQAVCNLASHPIDVEPVATRPQAAPSGEIGAAVESAVHQLEDTGAVKLAGDHEPEAPAKADQELPPPRQ